MTGVVYCIGEKPGGPVKIGVATDITQRLAAIQCGNHLEMRAIWVTPGGFDLESRFHTRFDYLRIRGEWFMDCGNAITGTNGFLPDPHNAAPISPISGDFRTAFVAAVAEHGSSVTRLSDGSGVSRDVVNKLLSRAGSSTSAENAVALAAVFGLSVNDFIAVYTRNAQ